MFRPAKNGRNVAKNTGNVELFSDGDPSKLVVL